MKRSQVKASAPFLRRITLLPEKVDRTRHPFDVAALRGLDLELRSRVTFFVGENDNRGDLASALRLAWVPKVTDGFFMRAESFFNFASYIDQVSTLQRYGGRRLHEQSHGESFLALFVNRFYRGVYVLDEPEAALSPQRQLAFLKVIHDLEATGQAQFLIASHSPILLAYPNATLLSLDLKHLFDISNDEDDSP
jgi:predicted ATPase